MKAQKIYTILAFTGTLFLSVGCNKLVDMKPLNEISDASYWKNADQFKLAANEFYTYLRSFGDILDNNPHSDRRSDIIFTRDGANTFSNGTNTVPNTDGSWSGAYSRIRAINYLLSKSEGFSSPSEIEKYVAEAKFSGLICTSICCSYLEVFQLSKPFSQPNLLNYKQPATAAMK